MWIHFTGPLAVVQHVPTGKTRFYGKNSETLTEREEWREILITQDRQVGNSLIPGGEKSRELAPYAYFVGWIATFITSLHIQCLSLYSTALTLSDESCNLKRKLRGNVHATLPSPEMGSKKAGVYAGPDISRAPSRFCYMEGEHRHTT